MSSAESLAYFLDEAEVAAILPDWPAEMSLAICLDGAGACEMVVFHRDESERILDRVAEVMNRAPGSFAVTPEVEGWPTRRILFSEERKLMALVAGAERLSETAADYAINFNFAREEGLDPEALIRTGAKTGSDLAAGAAPRVRQPEEDWTAETDEAEAPDDWAQPAPRSAEGLPPGYFWADEDRRPECQFANGRLSVQGGRIRLTVEPAAVAAETLPELVSGIAFREDFGRFMLRRSALRASWQPGEGAILDIPAELFPETLADRFRRKPYAAHVTVTGEGIFVAPGRALESIAHEARPAVPGRRRKIVTPIRMMAVGLVALGLASGGVVNALQQGPGETRLASAELPGQAPAADAMALISAFANAGE